MLPAKEDIYIRRGDSYFKAVEAELPTLAPLVPGDWSARAHYRKNKNASALVAFAVSITAIEDDETLRIEISLTPDQTADDISTPGVWDLEVTYPDGSVVTWLEGVAKFSKDVSR